MTIRPHDIMLAMAGSSGVAARIQANKIFIGFDEDVLLNVIKKAVQSSFEGHPPYAFDADEALGQIREIAGEALEGPYAKKYEACFLEVVKTLGILHKNVDNTKVDDTITREPSRVSVENQSDQTEHPKSESDASESTVLFVDIEGLAAALGDKLYQFNVAGEGAPVSMDFNGELIKLPSVLPPPPPASHPNITDWLEGHPWHPLAIGTRVHQNQDDDFDSMMEIQSEFFSSPEFACKTYSARPECDASKSNSVAESLDAACRDLGAFSITFDAVPEVLTTEILNYYKDNESEKFEFLMRRGVTFQYNVQLVAIVGSAIDMEAFYLKDAAGLDMSGEQFDPRGTISEANDLRECNVLRRAMYLHFSASEPIPDALTLALNEFRHAQINKVSGVFISPDLFDPIFQTDKFTKIEEYLSILSLDNVLETSNEENESPSWV